MATQEVIVPHDAVQGVLAYLLGKRIDMKLAISLVVDCDPEVAKKAGLHETLSPRLPLLTPLQKEMITHIGGRVSSRVIPLITNMSLPPGMAEQFAELSCQPDVTDPKVLAYIFAHASRERDLRVYWGEHLRVPLLAAVHIAVEQLQVRDSCVLTLQGTEMSFGEAIQKSI